MPFPRYILTVIGSAMLIAAAGCATTRPGVSEPARAGESAPAQSGLPDSAEKLDMNARALAAHSDTVGPSYEQDAHELAKRAHDFRSMVDTASVSNEEVRAQFELVSQSYHRMREQVEHARTQQAYADLEPVTAAYRDVQRELGITPGAETEPATSG